MASDEMGKWGRDDMMAIAAVRYCLGRMTYIVSDCADWLIAHWPDICQNARIVIQRDVQDAFVEDDDGRRRGESYRRLGMDCDRQQWERVRRLWKSDGQ